MRGRGSNIINRQPDPVENTRSGSVSKASGYDDDDDFSKYVYRRVKRFYVGGFNNSITTDKLCSYEQKRGVTVTWVTIFPIKQSNRVLIRLNVEDNDNSDYVLDNHFWPRFVVCKPWLSRGSRERRRHAANPQSQAYGSNDAHHYGRYDDYYDDDDDQYDDYRYYDRY